MPRDLTLVLGRLLADADLRALLRRDPSAAAEALDASPDDLAGLDADDLEAQAETLVGKRLHEVAKLLPRSTTPELFRAHAAAFWPRGHRRHLEDALAFARFLEDRGAPRSRSEIRRLRFAAGSGRWSAGFVSDAPLGGRTRTALQVLWRSPRGVETRHLYLGL